MYNHLIDENRDIENVTEWAKRERCWNQAKEIDVELLEEFIDGLQLIEDQKREEKENKKEQKLENAINQTVNVFQFGVDNWKYLLDWNNSHGVLNMTEIQFVKVAIDIEKGKIPSDKQSAKIMLVLNHAREEGFPK